MGYTVLGVTELDRTEGLTLSLVKKAPTLRTAGKEERWGYRGWGWFEAACEKTL